MKIKEIEFETPPEDLINGCLDVFITLEDNSLYFVEITTPQFLQVLMGGSKFLPPQYPYIIVSELTDEVIKAAIEEFISAEENSYWLKLYHITPTLDIEDIHRILNRKKQEALKTDLQVEFEMFLESLIDPNISSDNRVILESMFFLSIVSLILYCFLKPELFNLFSNFIN